jgi:mRNA interferase HigB
MTASIKLNVYDTSTLRIIFYFCSHFGNFLVYLPLRVIAKSTLRNFWEIHKDCEQALKSWYKEATEADWSAPSEIRSDYPTASFLENNRVVFNIKGNKYRLIVKINYSHKIVWIRFAGTHAEYDKINAKTI